MTTTATEYDAEELAVTVRRLCLTWVGGFLIAGFSNACGLLDRQMSEQSILANICLPAQRSSQLLRLT